MQAKVGVEVIEQFEKKLHLLPDKENKTIENGFN
jgi:hypothetical protein